MALISFVFGPSGSFSFSPSIAARTYFMSKRFLAVVKAFFCVSAELKGSEPFFSEVLPKSDDLCARAPLSSNLLLLSARVVLELKAATILPSESASDEFINYLAACYCRVFSLKHSRQSGMYMSAPPISILRPGLFYCASCLKVKEALAPQILQIELRFFIFSASGMRFDIDGQACLRKSLFSADIMTILPRLAASSANSTNFK